MLKMRLLNLVWEITIPNFISRKIIWQYLMGENRESAIFNFEKYF